MSGADVLDEMHGLMNGRPPAWTERAARAAGWLAAGAAAMACAAFGGIAAWVIDQRRGR